MDSHTCGSSCKFPTPIMPSKWENSYRSQLILQNPLNQLCQDHSTSTLPDQKECTVCVGKWLPDETAFDHLKQKLTQAPGLSYPSVDHPYILETDVSIQDLGAILSQEQDRRIHPVAYGSLFPQEHNCRITELETLAVVWAISHFKFKFYGNSVTMYTDHSPIKVIRKTRSSTGKHATWWTKVYGSCLN